MPDGRAIDARDWPSWVKLDCVPVGLVNRRLRLADIFSGCGGMALGACEGARNSMQLVDLRLAVDINARALRVMSDNFKLDSKRAVCSDIRKIFPGNLGDALDPVERKFRRRVDEIDLLTAGPPCQGHSNLNNHSRRSDPRNLLYLSAIRAVEVLRPSVAIIENVPAVIHDHGRHQQDGERFLRSLGYETAGRVVSMTNYGVPQRRKRHVLIASKIHSRIQLEISLKPATQCLVPIRDFIGDIENEPEYKFGPFYSPARASGTNAERIRWLFENDQFDLPNSLRPPCHRDKAHSYKSMYGRLDWRAPAQTITSGFGSMGQGRFVHPSRQRTLTCHEAARIQGFPDFYSFATCDSQTALREMIGNAVPPQLCAELVKKLFGTNIQPDL